MTRKTIEVRDYRVIYKNDSGEQRELLKALNIADARKSAKEQGIRKIQSITYVPPIKFSSTPAFDRWADSVCPRIEM